MSDESIFAAALVISNPSRRSEYLDQACRGNPNLRRDVDALLAAHAADSPLDRASDGGPSLAATCLPDSNLSGAVIAGRYKLLEQIGDGGMGTVWMAEQREPVKRLVAVKLIKPGMDSKAVLARFEAERQALAMMDHPNIAKVLDAGTGDDGRPFFVMELVKGLPLSEYCDARRFSVNARLELFIQICSAVQHAHQKAVIHRDLKPSNVLVTEHDGKPIPKVIDFGLAKALGATNVLTERTLHTAYGTVVGTPLYMAPEQVGINALDVDTRSDIYSLGVLLYELLTGSTPLEKARFKEVAWEEVKRLIREEEPPKPSARLSSDLTLPSLAASRQVESAQLRRLIRGDLDWIVMKALDKDRSRRYETANGLAADVRRYLANEPVVARPPSAAYRFQKAFRRNKAAFLAGAAVVVALLVGLSLSLWQADRATRASIAADTARQQAKESESKALSAEASERELREQADKQALAERKRRYASDMNLVQQALAMHSLSRAQSLLNRNRPAPGETDLRGWEWRYLWNQARPDDHEIHLHGGTPIERLQFGGDGQLAYFHNASNNSGDTVVVNVSSGTTIFKAKTNIGIAIARQSGLLAYTQTQSRQSPPSRQSTLHIFDLAAGKEALPLKEIPGEAWYQEFTPDERILVTVSYGLRDRLSRREGNCVLMASDVATGETLWRQPVNCLSASRNNRRLDIAPDGKSVALSVLGPDSRRTPYADGQVSVFNMHDGQKRFDIKSTNEIAMAVRFSPDSSLLATSGGYHDPVIRLWDARDGQPRGTLEGHRSYVTGLVFTPDGDKLLSSSGDYTIRIWDLSERRPAGMLRGHLDEVLGLCLSPDGKRLASNGKDGTIYLWDLSRLRQRSGCQTFDSSGPVSSFNSTTFEFTADSRYIVEKPALSRPTIRDLNSLQLAEPPLELSDRAVCLALSPDASQVVVARRDMVEPEQFKWTATVLDVRTGQQIESFTIPNQNGLPPQGFSYSAGGKTLVKCFRERFGQNSAGSLRFRYHLDTWDTDTWQHRHAVLPFVPEGTSLKPTRLVLQDHFAFISRRRVYVFDAARPEQKPRRFELPPGRDTPLKGFAVRPDGASAASVCEDGYLWIWDWKTQELRRREKTFLQGAHSVDYSPDGRRLAAGGGREEAVKVFDTDTWDELLTLAGEGSLFTKLKFSPNEKYLVGVNGAGCVHVWSAPTLEEIAAIEAKEKTPKQQP